VLCFRTEDSSAFIKCGGWDTPGFFFRGSCFTLPLHRPAHDCAAPPSKVRCAHTGRASASGAQISAVARFGGAQQLRSTRSGWSGRWRRSPPQVPAPRPRPLRRSAACEMVRGRAHQHPLSGVSVQERPVAWQRGLQLPRLHRMLPQLAPLWSVRFWLWPAEQLSVKLPLV
jgi:hypothetical protein